MAEAKKAEPKPKPAGAQPLWREPDSPQDRVERQSQARRTQVARLLLLMLGVLVLLGAVVYWLTPVPRPYFAGFWNIEFESRQLPLPDHMIQDRDALRNANFFPRKSPHAFQSLDRGVLVTALTDLANRSPLDQCVIYLAGNARYGEQGDAYIFPADANPGKPTSWLALRTVLELVRDCPCRHKLLVLDIMDPIADPRIGILSDDVARAVQNDLKAVADPHRLVLCSASPGQVSLASAELGRTVFGYYLEEGLMGWADGYGTFAPPDRRVSVKELAAYLTARVDRWAWRNRLTRQTPILHGEGEDFPLLVLAQGEPKTHLKGVDEWTYPTWLAGGWKMRAAWYQEGVYRTMPHLFHELEKVLLDAEDEWDSGIDEAHARDNRQQQLQALEARRKLFRFPPDPEPFSLALAVAQGQTPDKATLDTLRDLLAKRSPPAGKADKPDPAAEKTTLDAIEKLRARPHFDVAYAAFELTAADPNPSPDNIRFLNSLLQMQEARPRYVETLFLLQLQDLAVQTGDQNWPRAVVRRALDVVRVGERAASQPETFGWVRGLLEEAAQARHNAEVMLFARGYAPLDQVEQYLHRALEVYEICQSQSDALQKAQRTLDDALSFLPFQWGFIERTPRYEKDWQAAVQAADALYAALAVPDGPPLNREQLRLRAEDVNTKTDELQGRMDDLRLPFGPAAIASLKSVTERADAGAYLLLDIEAVLATPFVKADDRLALWKAHQALARRLNQQTRALDEAEDYGEQTITARFGAEGDPARISQLQREATARRSRMSIALLQLAGLPSTQLQPLEDMLQKATLADTPENPGPAMWYPLGRALRLFWNEQLPTLLSSDQNGSARDRISRVFSLVDVGQFQPDPEVTPQILLRQQQSRALWAWLANRYRYLNRDAVNLGFSSGSVATFAAAAARSYQQAAGGIPEEQFVQLTGAAELPAPPPTGAPVQYAVSLQLFAPPSVKTDAVLRVFTADDTWLRVTPEIKDVPPGQADVPLGLPFNTPLSVPFRIEVKPGAARSGVPPPAGFLVQVSLNGRTYHRLVPVSLQSVTDRLEILLSANPKLPTSPLGELRLRPIKPLQPYYLYVRNPTTRPRELIVQLLSQGILLEGAEGKVAIGVNETERILFPIPTNLTVPGKPAAGPPDPPNELPRLDGPIEVRLLDATDRKKVLERKFIPVGLASPREYVTVTNILFSPPRERGGVDSNNRLSVGLVSPLTSGPPCYAELVLPSDRIPGFLGVKDGNFKGEVPIGGEELKLYADNLQLLPGADEQGYCYLTIDNATRAIIFRVTYARGGEPTTPREDTQPAIRVNAPRFGVTGDVLPVQIEVDNAPANATVELAIGRPAGGGFEIDSSMKFPSGRQTRIGFFPYGKNGALLFDASIQDWNIKLDTLRIKGPRTLKARLLAADGQTVRTAEMTIILDDTPPDKVQILNPPKAAKKDAPLTLKAFAQPPVSGIKEVNFFIGQPVNGKLPPKTMLFKAEPDPSGAFWTATLPLQGENKGPTDFSVEFKSEAGLSGFATTNIDLLDKEPPPEPGKIAGQVLEGLRPQPKLPVILLDEKDKELSRTMSDADGNYEFPNLKPGLYRVYTIKEVNKRKADVQTKVEAGQTTKLDLPLMLN
ncbi:MAG: hypothetical protein JNM56_39120 [Planctomycetia bacterium]|nr:hypothetical protein [Planctomycetia bacterium]